MESLESNQQIRHFLLGNNAISTTGAKRIAEFLNKHPNRMETWYLAGCHITRHGLSLLVPSMKTSSTITNLWFKRNPFGPNSRALLAELVVQNTPTSNLRSGDHRVGRRGNSTLHRHLWAPICTPKSLLECQWNRSKCLRQSRQIPRRSTLYSREYFPINKSNRGCWHAFPLSWVSEKQDVEATHMCFHWSHKQGSVVSCNRTFRIQSSSPSP